MAKTTAAKTSKSGGKNVAESASKAGAQAHDSASFEERLEKLEKLGEMIRKPDIPLDEALKAFEEGIQLARGLEQDLEKIESRIEILVSASDAQGEAAPELELFEGGK